MSLSELFNTSTVADLWDTTQAADDYSTPLPSGTYEMEAVRGNTFNSTHGTPGYKITWRVKAGECEGRLVWHDLWLTSKAMSMSKRDLAKLGITNPKELDKPLPDGIIARVQLVKRQRDDGTDYNEVKRFDVLRVESDPFAPVDCPDTMAADKTEAESMAANKMEADTPSPTPPPEADTQRNGTAIADFISLVADKIPEGQAVSRATLSKQLAPMSEGRITQALEVLRGHGLQFLVIDANYAHYWIKRPVFISIPTERELTDDEFYKELEGGMDAK